MAVNPWYLQQKTRFRREPRHVHWGSSGKCGLRCTPLGGGAAALRRLKLYIAASLDGYIAGPNGEIDWLDVAGDLDYGYAEFYASIDTTLMGSSTYRVTLSVPEFPYADKTNYVFTRSSPPPDTEHVRFVSDDVAGFVRSLKEDARRGDLAGRRRADRYDNAQRGADRRPDPDLVPRGVGRRDSAIRARRGARQIRDNRVRDLRDGPRAVANGEEALTQRERDCGGPIRCASATDRAVSSRLS